jgi:MGT family glycosyltransferase
MIAQILDLPAITSMVYILTPHLLTHRALSPQMSRSIEAQSKAGLIIQSMYRKLCETYRQSPLDTLDYLCHTEPLNIVFMPRALHPDAEQFDERFAFVGASFNPQRDANLTPSVHDLLSGFPPDKADRPLLYISLGTLYNQRPDFFRQCLRAFGSEDLRVILSLGEGLRKEELGPLPANIQAASYVPQLEVLQRASAFITHGGANSVMEAFSFGVPIIVVPQNDEQTLTATRVVELGLGCALESANLSESVLHTAVSQVQQPAIRATVSQMQTAVQAAGGAERAAEIMLQHCLAL